MKSAKAAWQLAKSRKLAGDDTLFNALHEKAGASENERSCLFAC